MKRAKFFRYHFLGLIFWASVAIGVYVTCCRISLPEYLQSPAIADALGLAVIPGVALLAWIITLAERAIGGAYDQPTEWDELIEKDRRSNKEHERR